MPRRKRTSLQKIVSLLSNWGQLLIRAGITGETDDAIAKRVIVANFTNLLVVLICLPFLLLFTVSEKAPLAGGVAAIVILFLGLIGLNAAGLFIASRVGTFLISNLSILGFAIALGRDSATHLILFSLGASPLIFFETKEWIWAALCGCFALVSLFTFQRLDVAPLLPLSHEFLEWYSLSQILLTFVFLVTPTLYLQRVNRLFAARLATTANLSAIGELACTLAHEINNPLAVISGKAFQLKRHLAESPSNNQERVNRDLATINDMVTRVTHIIRGIKTFSREAESEPLKESNINSWASDTLQFIRDLSHGRPSRLDFIMSVQENLRLRGRPTQLSQVLINLVNNAFDAVQDLEEQWLMSSPP